PEASPSPQYRNGASASTVVRYPDPDPWVTVAVWAESSNADPTEFTAVSRTRSVFPRSAAATTYDIPVAPAMLAQPFGAAHCCHWYDSVIGCVPDHEPAALVRVAPTCGVPKIDGDVIDTGAWFEPA